MKQRNAFSLVELSIVLVIVGLLVGGILAGKSLIRASELRAVSTEYNRYRSATFAFRDKYFALPGDLTNATGFWGAADGSTGLTVACRTANSGTATTCNGNGNQQIITSTGSQEHHRFWQHLVNAGMIEGNYSGVPIAATTSVDTTNAPSSRMQGGLWFAYYFGDVSGTSLRFDGAYGNSFEFGAQTSNAHPSGDIMLPEEAWNIDTKLDDAMPATGRIVTADFNVCTPAVLSTELTVAYDLTVKDEACALIFRNQF